MSWPIVALDDVADIQRNGIDPMSLEGDKLYVGLEHIETGGRLLDIKPVSNGELKSTKFSFGPDHILYGKLRPYLAKIALPNFDGICSTDILPILPGPKIDRSYLSYYLRQPSMIEHASSRAEGANLPRLSPKALAKFGIPLPPIMEQKRIAVILDKADQLRQKRRQAIALLDSLTQSIFLEMFGEAASQDWPTATIDEVSLDIRTGPFGSQLLHSEFVDEGIAVLGIDNAVNNRFEWGKSRFITEAKYRDMSKYTVRPRDVIITIMGTCGRCAIVPDNIPTAINTKHLCCITLNQKIVSPHYLHACFLNNRSVLRQLGVKAKGAVMPGLNMGIVKSLVIPIPPVALQERFHYLLRTALRQAEMSESATSQGNLLFASLQDRAFAGQL